jgi:hypothetical protein
MWCKSYRIWNFTTNWGALKEEGEEVEIIRQSRN